MKGFKEFLMRGNIVDLAVAVIIGAAFTAVVNAFATDFIGGLITEMTGAVGADGNMANIENVTIPNTSIVWGTTLTALINFVVVAAIVYFFVVLPMKRLMELTKKDEEEKAAEPSEVELLKEIRDLLNKQKV